MENKNVEEVVSVDTENPVVTEPPVEAEAPVEVEAPAEVEAPVEVETPVISETPVVTVSAEKPKKEKKSGKKVKIIGIVGVLVVILAILILTSSSPSEKVTEKIEKIGAVSLESAMVIEEAEQAYAELEESAKAEVLNYEVLEAAREKYDSIKAVYDAIEAIGEVKNSEKSEQAIGAARDLYNDLSSEDATLVTNYEKLEEAEKVYSEFQVENTISLIKKIGEVSLKSESKIKKAREKYNSLSAEAKKKVKNYKTLTKAEDTFKKLKKEKGKKLLSGMRVENDKVRGMKFYYPSAFRFYRDYWLADERCFVLPYIGYQDGSYWLRLIFNYTDDDWVFFKKVIVAADDERFTETFSYFDIVRDNGGGDVWEYIDIEVGESEIEMLRAIANSKETIVRFQGDDYSSDFTVKSSDKAAIKQVLDAYEYLK